MSLEHKHAILDALMTAVDEETALEIIDYRNSKPTKKPFDVYRARLVVDQLMRSADRNARVWEMVKLDANKDKLTVEFVRNVYRYDPDSGQIIRRSTGKVVGCKTPAGYLIVPVAADLVLAHRLAWFYTYGRWPRDYIDHINRDRSDNRLANLRECNLSENAWNLENPRNSSGFKGVHWDAARKRWMATIQIDGRTKCLGRFKDIESAAQAYRKAENDHRGHFLSRRGAA